MLSKFKHCVIEWSYCNERDYSFNQFGRAYKIIDDQVIWAGLTISDYLHKSPLFIFISKVEVDPEFRSKGYGSKAVLKFCRKHRKYDIMLEAGFLYYEEYEAVENDTEKCEQHIASLVSFYERLSFTNVNSLYGSNQHCVALLHERTSFRRRKRLS